MCQNSAPLSGNFRAGTALFPTDPFVVRGENLGNGGRELKQRRRVLAHERVACLALDRSQKGPHNRGTLPTVRHVGRGVAHELGVDLRLQAGG